MASAGSVWEEPFGSGVYSLQIIQLHGKAWSHQTQLFLGAASSCAAWHCIGFCCKSEGTGVACGTLLYLHFLRIWFCVVSNKEETVLGLSLDLSLS